MTTTRWLTTSQQQAWRALNVITNRGLPQLEVTFRDNDMLRVEYGILVALSEAPDSEMSLSELADHANTSQSRLSHRLRGLIDQGEVSSRACESDRRVTYAQLTKAGRNKLEAVAPQHAEDVLQLLFDHLNTDQTEGLADALSTIAATLCSHDEYHAPKVGG
ncbi:MAG: DNA-binding MarR family transcriptional regulator [Candidatus Poriferisodalaceae bacterium]|jgi:DNA-binding MarR family transcriptional regulator